MGDVAQNNEDEVWNVVRGSGPAPRGNRLGSRLPVVCHYHVDLLRVLTLCLVQSLHSDYMVRQRWRKVHDPSVLTVGSGKDWVKD